LQFCGVIYVRLKIDKTDGCRDASPVMCAYGLGTAGAPNTPDRCSDALSSVDRRRRHRILAELATIAMSVLGSEESAA
jgi:hypothetical protein